MKSKVKLEIKIYKNIKKDAQELFDTLGLDLSTAINIFLHKCLLTNGIPFEIKIPSYKKEVIEKMNKAKELSKDINTKSCSSFKELKEDLKKDD